ncbi:hypothetical protein MMC13_003703 [Lambiella insularis]|nr:hypothetical protein [Lambiella insularis]
MTSDTPDLEALADSCLHAAKTIKAFLASSSNGRPASDSLSTKAINTPDLETLAESCLQSVKTIKEFLATSNGGRLAFDAQALPRFPKCDAATERARNTLRNTAKTLYDLATGPEQSLVESCLTSLQYINSMRYICHFGIPDLVPEGDTIDYLSLANACAVDPIQLKQHIRFAITNHVFCEPSHNHIAHTVGSLALKDGRPMRASVQWLTEDCAPMMAHQLDALKKWGHGSQEPDQTAVSYAYGGEGGFYGFIQSDPARERRFGTTIQQVAQQPRSSLTHIQTGFDWKSLGAATVVDFGGHVGDCAVAIAEAAPELRLIVQDRPEVVAMAEDPKTSVVPTRLQDRVSFEAHDFYQPQKTPADVFFCRKTLLNHTDKYASKVIQALAPVLKLGNRLLIMDFVQSDGAIEATPIERFTRAVDLQMLLYYNSRYRTLEEWKGLVSSSNDKFEFETVCTPAGSGLAIMSWIFRGDAMSDGSTSNGLLSNASMENDSVGNVPMSNGPVSNIPVGNDSVGNDFVSNGSMSNGSMPNGYVGNGSVGSGSLPGPMGNDSLGGELDSMGSMSNGSMVNGSQS